MKKFDLKSTMKNHFKKIVMLFCFLALHTTYKALCPLNASFSYTVGANGVVNFASTSTGTTASSTYQWYFLPGTATGPTATHTFTNGTFPVFLYVNNVSCFDSTVVYITVNTSTCNLNANFTYSVGANNVVNFASTSTGTNSGTTYQWYFNPGIASGATASHSFSTNGNHAVTLFIQNGTCTDSITYNISVCNLNASFTYTVGANGVVNFSSTSTGTTAGTTYQWYFFPGTASTPNPSHTYTNGNHSVVLYLYDGNCFDSTYMSVFVNTNTCNINANFSYSVGANNSVSFTSTSTGTTAGTTYQWYFYPGSATGSTATHTFATNGNHQVTLYVQNGTCSDSVTYNVSVCNMNANFNYTVGPNGVVNFASTSTGTTASSTYQWYFLPGTSTGATTTHTFTNNGNYPVFLYVNDGSCFDSTAIYITVNTATCNLNANFNYTVNANGSVNFASTSTGTTPFTQYQWFFYPGSAFGQTTTHNYSNNGTYPVTLYLSDSLCTDSITQYITIGSGPCNLNANFNYTVNANGSVNFASTSTGTTPFTQYQWFFYPGSSFGQTTTHNYSNNGTYPVTLYLSDSLCTDSITQYITIGSIPCNLNANFNYTVNANGSVNFASTSTGTTPFTQYQWFFYPGSSFGQTTTQNYSNNGTYPVTLYLSDSLCTDSITQYITITNSVCNLNANFNYTVLPNGVVHFVSTTTGASPFANYYWSFGDSQNGFGSTVNHTYSPSGIFNVYLHVYDSLCSDSAMITINTNLISGIKSNSTINTSVKIYPNPNNGEFILSINNIDIKAKTTDVLIFNTLGQVIFRNTYENENGELHKKINIDELPGGAYILKLNNGTQNYTGRFIIQK
ncbi:MAG: PKD domain-containing protein [Bacteroidota bacterium]|nr:PKD domain-containing protein [Bacteroidota bacterium]